MAARNSNSYYKLARSYCFLQSQRRCFSAKQFPWSSTNSDKLQEEETNSGTQDVTAGIGRPLSDVLKDLSKKVPESLISLRTQPDGFSAKYIPWHILNRILNLHTPEWSGEVRSITYSSDGKVVSVVYRVTLYGTDAEIFREATGSASVSDTSYGDPVQKAEAMAFRRACARLGLGLHLYHEDME